VANSHDQHDERLVTDGVDHPEGTDAKPVEILAPHEAPDTRGARIVGQGIDARAEADLRRSR